MKKHNTKQNDQIYEQLSDFSKTSEGDKEKQIDERR